MKKFILKYALVLLLCTWIFTGCGETPGTPEAQEEIVIQGNYKETLADSMDEAVIMSVDEEKNFIQFYNLTIGRTYTLSYDGTTGMKNKFGDEMVAGQFASGDMVRVTFIKDEKRAKSLQLLDDVSVSRIDSGYEINKAAYTMSFGGDQYALHKNAVVLFKGKQIQMEEINPVDGLKIIARDHEVYAITVETGHGYVRLTGHESFVGGFIEIGQTVIREVTDEMLIVVPEGEYSLYISNNGVAGSKDISVVSDEETLVDVSELQTEKIKKTGKIIFTITPATAKLYVDGNETDYSGEVELDYGIHQISVKEEGYSTLTQYIKVREPMSNLNIALEESDGSEEEEDEDDNKTEEKKPAVSSNSTNTAGASDYRVYIDAPVGAELYLNGSYVGVVPANFPKQAGTYIISLRRDGYQTRSYTLQIDSSNKDISYSFSELEMQ